MYEFDWSSIPGALPFLWQGMKLSLAITFVAVAAGMVWGTVLAVLRLSPVAPLSFFAASYVSLFRSVPLVMVLLWFFLIVPQLLRDLLHLSHAADFRVASAMVALISVVRKLRPIEVDIHQSARTRDGPAEKP